MSETPLLSRSSRSSSSASSSSTFLGSPIMLPLSKSPTSFSRLPTPVTSNKPNKRKLRIVVFQLLGCFVLLSWAVYPFLSNANSNSSILRLNVNPAIEALLPKQGNSSPVSIDSNPNQVYETTEGMKRGNKEAYVTFLSSITDEFYLLSTRLLIYQLLNDPSTLDSTHSRDVVVVTTPGINEQTADILRSEGAIVKQVELLDGFELPKEIAGNENHHWKDQYTKLHIFNMTEYDRILYLDNDIFLLKSLEDIWSSQESNIPFGLGGIGENTKENLKNTDLRIEPPSTDLMENRDYLNAGFMLIRPDQNLFEDLRQVKGYDTFYMEQALINHYFDWNGSHPWTPLNPKFVSHYPKVADMKEGYYSLHAKMWKDPVHQGVKSAWKEGIRRMDDFWKRRGKN